MMEEHYFKTFENYGPNIKGVDWENKGGGGEM